MRAGRRARAAAWLAAAALLSGAAPPPPDLHGPLSDFWARVRRDWNRRLPGLNHGSLQTAIWVAMIWDGPDDLQVDDIAARLRERESMRWVRSQITLSRYADLPKRDLSRQQAFRQNIILLGTPEDNRLIGRALDATPLRAAAGRITIGRRRLTGDGLLLLALAPNPVDPRRYALVITGSSAAALRNAGSVPYGETDYVVFRGRRVVERGFFKWDGGTPARDAVDVSQSFSDHFGWVTKESSRFRLHYDPAAADDDAVAAFGRRIDAEMDAAAAFYGIEAGEAGRIDLYLYDSIDAKTDQTADARPAHLEPSDDSLHVVWSPRGGGAGGTGPAAGGRPGFLPGKMDGWDLSLAARLLLRRSEAWGARGERELPGLAQALSLACDDRFQTIPLAAWAARSTRDAGWMPIDALLSRRPAELESGDLAILDAAAFARELIRREGAARVAAFYRAASRQDFHARFKEAFGLTLAQAEARWSASLPRPAAIAAAGAVHAIPAAAPDLGPALAALRRRDDREAERLLLALDQRSAAVLTLRARLQFRGGRFEEAAATADAALLAGGGAAEDRAWARLTLGRARAMIGLLVAAGADLSASEIRDGPPAVRAVADLWLERLGRPLNGLAAGRILMEEASTDLMNFDWDAAERKLKIVLASDPRSREAHATLGQVYLSKYQYWYEKLLLDRELFPGESQADPESYRFLADKGRAELRLAEASPLQEPERWMTDPRPSDPGDNETITHLLTAKALMTRGEILAARREVETALELEPSDAGLASWCHLYLARIAAATGDKATAREQYGVVLTLAATADLTNLAKEELGRLPE